MASITTTQFHSECMNYNFTVKYKRLTGSKACIIILDAQWYFNKVCKLKDIPQDIDLIGICCPADLREQFYCNNEDFYKMLHEELLTQDHISSSWEHIFLFGHSLAGSYCLFDKNKSRGITITSTFRHYIIASPSRNLDLLGKLDYNTIFLAVAENEKIYRDIMLSSTTNDTNKKYTVYKNQNHRFTAIASIDFFRSHGM